MALNILWYLGLNKEGIMEPENLELNIDEDSEIAQPLYLLSWAKKTVDNNTTQGLFAGCRAFDQLGLWINPAIIEEEE